MIDTFQCKRYIKSVFFIAFLLLVAGAGRSQDKSALQKEREKLKQEIAATQKILDETSKSAKVNIGQLSLINKKLELQNTVIKSISGEIRQLTDNIYLSQLEINKIGRVLDTLKQEYAKSMIYAYKNRSNYDFLNFIFSAQNFNDAIKRVTYLKSYRNYREMQADNILKTQKILEEKIATLEKNKARKSSVLKERSGEYGKLEEQKEQKAKIVNSLRGKQKELQSQVAAKKKQDAKLKNTIDAMIRREIEIARAEAARKEKERLEALKRKEAEEKAAAARAAAAASAAKSSNKEAAPEEKKEVAKAPVAPAPAATPERKAGSVLVSSDADLALNSSFEKNKGSLPWPVDGYVISSYGKNSLPGNIDYYNPGVTIGAQVGSTVKAVFDGEVTLVSYIDDKQAVFIKHGKYFSVYSNLTSVSVKRGSKVTTGQAIGKAGENEEGEGGKVEFILMQESDNVNPQSWLRN